MLIGRFILPFTLVLTLTLGCDNAGDSQPPAETGGAQVSSATTAPNPEPVDAVGLPTGGDAARSGDIPDSLRGKVKKTADAGGYTYLLVATSRGEVWAAAEQFTVQIGDEVELTGLMPMHNFRSPTLGRTFEEIQFVSRARVLGDQTSADSSRKPHEPSMTRMPPGHPPIGASAAHARAGSATPPIAGEIEPLPDGLTVAALFNQKAALSGKRVKFRGRVVKANRAIMNKNWLHIQDGSGTAGSNDITVTSAADFAAPGSLVIVEGVLRLDRDFGAGYVYDLIVEDAGVAVEPLGADDKPDQADPG